MNTLTVRNNTENGIVISDMRSFYISASDIINLLDYFKPEEIARSDKLLEHLALSNLIVNNGSFDLTPGQAIRYISLHKHVNPTAPDGREIIRADSRPENTETYFTTTGDSVTDIGKGNSIRWDFSNNDNMYTVISGSNGPDIPSGMKVKQVDISYVDPIYIKEGTIYFFDAPWGAYCCLYIIVPAGSYYPNPSGTISAAALGLSGVEMYAYAATDVYYTNYVNKQFMYTSCPMGDELNAEGCQINALPPGWIIRCLIFTNESDNVSKGYASLEMYRNRTMLLPGCSV